MRFRTCVVLEEAAMVYRNSFWAGVRAECCRTDGGQVSLYSHTLTQLLLYSDSCWCIVLYYCFIRKKSTVIRGSTFRNGAPVMVLGIVMVVTCWSSGSDLTSAGLLVFKPLLEFMLASFNTVRQIDMGRFVPQWPVDCVLRFNVLLGKPWVLAFLRTPPRMHHPPTHHAD